VELDGQITKFDGSVEVYKVDVVDDVDVLFIILESSEKKSIEFCKGCIFNLECIINMNYV
jgi:hypothetical protein